MRTKALVSLAVLLGSTAAIAGVHAGVPQDSMTANNSVAGNNTTDDVPAPTPEPAPAPTPAPTNPTAPEKPGETTPPN